MVWHNLLFSYESVDRSGYTMLRIKKRKQYRGLWLASKRNGSETAWWSHRRESGEPWTEPGKRKSSCTNDADIFIFMGKISSPLILLSVKPQSDTRCIFIWCFCVPPTGFCYFITEILLIIVLGKNKSKNAHFTQLDRSMNNLIFCMSLKIISLK